MSDDRSHWQRCAAMRKADKGWNCGLGNCPVCDAPEQRVAAVGRDLHPHRAEARRLARSSIFDLLTCEKLLVECDGDVRIAEAAITAATALGSRQGDPVGLARALLAVRVKPS